MPSGVPVRARPWVLIKRDNSRFIFLTLLIVKVLSYIFDIIQTLSMKFIYWLSLISTLIACQNKDAPIKNQINTVPVVLVKVQNVPIYNEFVGQTYGLKDIPIR